jgi:hypothetical protein
MLANYLVAGSYDTELGERYARACAAHGIADSADLVTRVALKMPMLLGLLDAGAALLGPGHPLRRKLVVMTALLECTPAGSAHFMPVGGGARAWLRLVGYSLLAGVKAVFGAPLFVLLGGRKVTG